MLTVVVGLGSVVVTTLVDVDVRVQRLVEVDHFVLYGTLEVVIVV